MICPRVIACNVIAVTGKLRCCSTRYVWIAETRTSHGSARGTVTAMPETVQWLDKPQVHDFPAAVDYLDLIVSHVHELKSILGRLQAGNVAYKKAKDILRASRLALLPADEKHVAADLAKIKQGKRLSPILLVRGDILIGIPLQIADGYHRVCASYHTDANTDIPVVLVDAWDTT